MVFVKNRRWFLNMFLWIGLWLGMVSSTASLSWAGISLSLPGVDRQNEHRQAVDESQIPWSIMGRVQTDLGQRCTGFLISNRLAITAAHCLWIRKTRHFIDPGSIHFLLGYQRQDYRIAYCVLNVIKSDHYQGSGINDRSFENMTQDWVYLVLAENQERAGAFLPFNHGVPQVGMNLSLAGYEQDHQERLYGDQHCHVVRVLSVKGKGILFEHDCQGTFGSSGAPVFTRNAKGQWSITGIQIAAFTNHAGGIAFFLSEPP